MGCNKKEGNTENARTGIVTRLGWGLLGPVQRHLVLPPGGRYAGLLNQLRHLPLKALDLLLRRLLCLLLQARGGVCRGPRRLIQRVKEAATSGGTARCGARVASSTDARHGAGRAVGQSGGGAAEAGYNGRACPPAHEACRRLAGGGGTSAVGGTNGRLQ